MLSLAELSIVTPSIRRFRSLVWNGARQVFWQFTTFYFTIVRLWERFICETFAHHGQS